MFFGKKKGDPKQSIFSMPLLQKRSVRIWLAVIIIFSVFGGGALFVWLTAKNMFSENPRFAVRTITVKSVGYWKGREREICDMLKIRPGISNLFALDLGGLRGRLAREASIEHVSVQRILPDTLIIDITERIPRAFVNSHPSTNPVWVVDSNCVLMESAKCMNIDNSLPVIIGVRPDTAPVPGMKIPSILSAMDLIMLTVRDYPMINIAYVSLIQPGQLVCGVFYRNNRNPEDAFRIYLPEKNLRESILKMVTAIEKVQKENNPTRQINLMYEGRGVLVAPPPPQPETPANAAPPQTHRKR